MKILKCIQHNLTQEQLKELYEMDKDVSIIDFKGDNPELFSKLSSLKFDADLDYLAKSLYDYINNLNVSYVIMPIGSPGLMFKYAKCVGLKGSNVKHLFAHTDRVAVENKNFDGIITKSTIFKHIGFIQ